MAWKTEDHSGDEELESALTEFMDERWPDRIQNSTPERPERVIAALRIEHAFREGWKRGVAAGLDPSRYLTQPRQGGAHGLKG